MKHGVCIEVLYDDGTQGGATAFVWAPTVAQAWRKFFAMRPDYYKDFKRFQVFRLK